MHATRGGRAPAHCCPSCGNGPDLPPPEPASPEVARFRLFDTLSGFLDRASKAEVLVMVLEDLHAADVAGDPEHAVELLGSALETSCGMTARRAVAGLLRRRGEHPHQARVTSRIQVAGWAVREHLHADGA